MTKARLDALAGILFFAAVHVLAAHFVDPAGRSRIVLRFIDNAQMELSFFFVLSGFILTYQYAERSFTAREFFVARFARIYPLFALSIVLELVAQLPVLTPRKATALGVQILGVHSLFPSLIQIGNVPAWSLSVEFFLYLVFPLSLRHLYPASEANESDAGLVLRMLGWWIAGLVFFRIGYATIDPADIHRLFFIHGPIGHFPAFCVGIGAGRLYLRDLRLGRDRPATLLTSVALVAIVALAFSPIFIPWGWAWASAHSLVSVPAFALLIYGLAHGGPLAKVLARPLWVRLGEASFAIYILQLPIVDNVGTYLLPGWTIVEPWFFVEVLALLVPVAVLVHDVVERPTQRLILARYSAARLTART